MPEWKDTVTLPRTEFPMKANLPAAESSYTGVDNRPRWVANAAYPACITSGGPFGTGGQAGPCVTRLNNAVGNSVTAAYAIKNQGQNYSWNLSGSVAKATEATLRGLRSGAWRSCWASSERAVRINVCGE